MHADMCFALMRTTNWPSLCTGKDHQNVLSNARDMHVEVLGWVRNLVRIPSALVLFTSNTGRIRMIKFLPRILSFLFCEC